MSALLEHNISGAAVAMVYDPGVASLCHQAGVGEWVTTTIGAEQLSVRGQVKQLSQGNFVATGPFYQGCQMQLGLMALLCIDGVDVVVTSKSVQAADQTMLTPFAG